MELLEPADVGDRLAGRAPLEGRPVARRGVVADRRIRVRSDDRPIDAERVAEQELGVEPRRLRAGVAQPLDRPRRGAAA